jgi:hypothetical protein
MPLNPSALTWNNTIKIFTICKKFCFKNFMIPTNTYLAPIWIKFSYTWCSLHSILRATISFQPNLIWNPNWFLMKSECTDNSFDVPPNKNALLVTIMNQCRICNRHGLVECEPAAQFHEADRSARDLRQTHWNMAISSSCHMSKTMKFRGDIDSSG